jgi:hypothetical protein
MEKKIFLISSFIFLFSALNFLIYCPYIIKKEHYAFTTRAPTTLEQKFNILRLSLNYNEKDYDLLLNNIIFANSCHEDCYDYFQKFFIIGLKHKNNIDISSSLIYFLIDEQNNDKNEKLKSLEELLYTLPIEHSMLNYFLCKYHTSNLSFINNLKNKYHITHPDCVNYND